MVVNGQIKNGRIVLDQEAPLPEGMKVRVEFLPDKAEEQNSESGALSLGERMKGFSGTAKNLPPDASVNIDHYLYGHPKQ